MKHMDERTKRAVKIAGAVVAVLGVIVWLHLSSRPASTSPAESSKSSAVAPTVAAANESRAVSNDESSTPVTVDRYPNIESPDSVAPEQDFAVQVSLTGEQLSPETNILSGAESGGKLQVKMDEGKQSTDIEVTLAAPGMEFSGGSTNTATITLPQNGDSSIALFHLRAKPIDGAEKPTQILATLWQNYVFLARIRRPITITTAPMVFGEWLRRCKLPGLLRLRSM